MTHGGTRYRMAANAFGIREAREWATSARLQPGLRKRATVRADAGPCPGEGERGGFPHRAPLPPGGPSVSHAFPYSAAYARPYVEITLAGRA